MNTATLDRSISDSRTMTFLPERDLRVPEGFIYYPAWEAPSPWSCSAAKRAFDCACVLLALPVLVPLMLAVAAAVRLTSRGPVLFLQKRVGRHRSVFTIFKFRTLVDAGETGHDANAATHEQCLTPIGRFLRRWKLDELPQLANVLFGQMSLVGPRPKLPQFMNFDLACRPGLTGRATTAFAREEKVLSRVPREHLDAYIHDAVLPAKRKLDAEYMARATFFTDLGLIVKTVFRRWDTAILEELPEVAEFVAKAPFAPPDRLCAAAGPRRMQSELEDALGQ